MKQSICSGLSTQRRTDEKNRSNMMSFMVQKIKIDTLIDASMQVLKKRILKNI